MSENLTIPTLKLQYFIRQKLFENSRFFVLISQLDRDFQTTGTLLFEFGEVAGSLTTF